MLQPRVAKFGLFTLVVLSIGVLIGRFLLGHRMSKWSSRAE